MDVVLDTMDASPGDAFRVLQRRTAFVCDTHNGGTWNLQIRPPGGTWQNVDGIEFDSVDQWDSLTPQGAEYRFAGGTMGARIYAEGVAT